MLNKIKTTVEHELALIIKDLAVFCQTTLMGIVAGLLLLILYGVVLFGSCAAVKLITDNGTIELITVILSTAIYYKAVKKSADTLAS